MEGEHAVAVVAVVDVDRLRAQRRMAAAQPDEVAGEAVEVGHVAVAPSSPSHQMNRSGGCGLSDQSLSSRNSWPMNSIGTPGAVSSRPVATRARLRAYQERGLSQSASLRDPRLRGGRRRRRGPGRGSRCSCRPATRAGSSTGRCSPCRTRPRSTRRARAARRLRERRRAPRPAARRRSRGRSPSRPAGCTTAEPRAGRPSTRRSAPPRACR